MELVSQTDGGNGEQLGRSFDDLVCCWVHQDVGR